MTTKRNALGKGLSALLENYDTDVTTKPLQKSGELTHEYIGIGTVANIPLERIEANPFQPRADFDESALHELAESIKKFDIIQPVTVRKLGYDKYQLISGERRYRAARIAGLTEIPAYIRIANDQAMLEMSLVENIQREELNAIEIAISFQRLIEECKLLQEELSKRVGKNRSTITNYLRLLKLPAEIQIGIKKKKITMGHARALVNVNDVKTQLSIYEDIVSKELSVRKTEDIVRNLNEQPYDSKKTASPTPLSSRYQQLKSDLSSHFNTKVDLKRYNNGKGKIVIPFESDDDMERIIKTFNL